MASQTVENIRTQVLFAAAKLFLENGYSGTTTRHIADEAGVNVSAMNRVFHSKENILAELVAYVLEGQFEATSKFLSGITEDPLLFYAAETVLQLYMAEVHENIRDLYIAAYSLPKTSQIIHTTIAGKLEQLFGKHLPQLEAKDFYELEIASGGIMRGFIAIPCDMYFTMERKVSRFLETAFLIFRVPEDKIREAIEFVAQFDFTALARNTIDNMLQQLVSTDIS